MRRIVTFQCESATLVGTLDQGTKKTGLLIISGGNEIRMGAHRGMAMLAAEIATLGYPVFRFDRRGIGDSEGNNDEFMSSGPDIDAAITALRAEAGVQRIVAFGNCDAASALLLHRPQGIDAAVLANIWVIERVDELPPPAAIKAHYLERLSDPAAWKALFTGAIDFKRLAKGLFRIAKPAPHSSLADQIAVALAVHPLPLSILLAERDATAIAFIDQWSKPAFAKARARKDISITKLDSPSHSFANTVDHTVLVETLRAALGS